MSLKQTKTTEEDLVNMILSNPSLPESKLCQIYNLSQYKLRKISGKYNIPIKRNPKGRPKYGDNMISDYIQSHPHCYVEEISEATGLCDKKVRSVISQNGFDVQKGKRGRKLGSKTCNIITFMHDNPDIRSVDIAKHFGVSRSYISQLRSKRKEA